MTKKGRLRWQQQQSRMDPPVAGCSCAPRHSEGAAERPLDAFHLPDTGLITTCKITR